VFEKMTGDKIAGPTRIPFDELLQALTAALRGLGFTDDRAGLCARLFAETTRDGVYTHGVNRFPRFVRMIQAGRIDIHAAPEFVRSHGAMERWNGHCGPGNVNAWQSMERAISLARQQGLGAVALANTTHWMRGGSYGWQAAEAGCIGICWTNTLPNLPPWGSSEARIGNNPLIIAVPRPSGPVVLDMAMSQFSYGALASYRERGEMLPVDGGFDSSGHLTRDPGAIEASQRPLPIGYWKGSGLAIVLDLIAAMLSGGLATHQIPKDPERETGISQFFLALDPSGLGGDGPEIADSIVTAAGARYPGQRTLEVRAENLALGVPVDPAIWNDVRAMGASR
jgi:3-dehydro-L-gulonate 2-dehydrogenase